MQAWPLVGGGGEMDEIAGDFPKWASIWSIVVVA